MAWDGFFRYMRGLSYEAVVDPDSYIEDLAKRTNDVRKEETHAILKSRDDK